MGVRLFTDPACPASWAFEPVLRRLMVEFGDDLRFTYVMGGLARETEGREQELLLGWLRAADDTGMPFDPLLWVDGPVRSTYPACMAVKAAAMQAGDGGYAYLRSLREGLLCFRRKLDTTEALVEEARRVGLDVARFRIDLESHATVEAFGADLEATRAVDRPAAPALCFGEDRWVYGPRPYPELRAAAEAAGARPTAGALTVTEALARFGRLAVPEVQAVCDLPEPRAHAELWRLAGEWRARPVKVLTGHLWEAA